MTEFIKYNENIKLWAHGHVHTTNDYYVNQCRVISNSFGYHGYETNYAFDPLMEVEV